LIFWRITTLKKAILEVHYCTPPFHAEPAPPTRRYSFYRHCWVTALMQENEQKAVALIKHYNTALNELVALHNGKVLNYYGDGSLCTFPSVTEALNCAIELQTELQSEPTVPLRIGLHVGEVFLRMKKR
jgi:hypothetical protein